MDIRKFAEKKVESYTKAFLELEEERTNREELIAERNEAFAKEVRNIYTKIHKFVSHFLRTSEQSLLKERNLDEEYLKWKKDREELHELINKGNHMEIFFRKSEIKQKKNAMKQEVYRLAYWCEDHIYDKVRQLVLNKVTTEISAIQAVFDMACAPNNLDTTLSTKAESTSLPSGKFPPN